MCGAVTALSALETIQHLCDKTVPAEAVETDSQQCQRSTCQAPQLTTSLMPRACASSASAGMSATTSVGLDTVSV